MEANCIEILLIDVTLDLQHVQKLVFNMLLITIKKKKSGPAVKGLNTHFVPNNSELIGK